MSVSSDLIAVPAWRCMGLLDRLGVNDRAGGDGAFEVYPAAALCAWGLRSRGYKGPKAGERRSALVDDLLALLPGIELADEHAALGKRLSAGQACLDAIGLGVLYRYRRFPRFRIKLQ